MEKSSDDEPSGKTSLRSEHSCAIFWKGFTGNLGISTYDVLRTVHIVKVSFGSGHSLFQSRDGDVFVCGDNAKGQLGLGTLDVKVRDQPIKISGLNAPAIDIACGENHCAVITNEGRAYCWGDSSSGQCGVGSLDVVLAPTPVLQEIHDGFCKEHGLPKPPVTVLFETVSCGANHSLAVSTDGAVWAWGCGSPLGLGEILHALVPRRVETLKDHMAIGVCCGKNHSMAMVLKGDKSKSSQLNSPPKVVAKAKDIEVDKHFPSRCKSCKKEIFSYTDTNDMCIIETLHDCGSRNINDDDSALGDDSFSMSAHDVDSESSTKNKSTVEGEVVSPASNPSSLSLTSSSTSKSVQETQLDQGDGSIGKSQTLFVSSSSVSCETVSSPEEIPCDDDPATHYLSVPETSLDCSLLCLPAELSLVEADAKELSPTKSSDNGKGSYAGEIEALADNAKVLFKSDNSVAVTSDDDSVSSMQLSSSERTGLSKNSESKPACKTDLCFSKDGNVGNQSEVTDGQSQDGQSLLRSHKGNPVYAKSISVESDDIVWKRQSESGDDFVQYVKSPKCQQRPSSPSSISVKSLNFIIQSDAMEYLQRQFEDNDTEKSENVDVSKKEIQPKKPKLKSSQSNVLPYTSMVMEQVKSMTSRALTNFQSLNVFGSQSGDSPTMELATVSKAGQNDRPGDLAKLANVSFSQSAAREDVKCADNETIKDEVFSSPESCSMISSVGSLTGEGVTDSSETKDLLACDDSFHTKIKSGTFIEWRQEMSSIGDNGATLSSNSNRRSLRTIEMQKRNLSSTSSEPLIKSDNGRQSAHPPVITTTEIWVWGHNKDGQLGLGDTIDRPDPVWLKGLSGRNVMKLAAGDSHCLALTDNSQVYAWGSNSHGQLGQNKTTDCPSRVKFPKGTMIWDVAAGTQHSIFLGDMSSGPPDVFYCGKQPNVETNEPLKKTVVPSPLPSIKENGSAIRVFAGGTKCSCKVLNTTPPVSEALFELAASERSFYGQLIKTINLLLRPLRRSSFFLSLDVFPYKSTLQNMIASFGHLTTKVGNGVTDLTATIQHDDCLLQTLFIKDRSEFIETFRNYSRSFSDFLAVGGFEYCTRTGSEFFNDIQGTIQDLPDSKEKTNASSSLFLRAMRYPFFRLSEYSRIISKMVESTQEVSEDKKVFQNTVLDWESLKLNFTSEHKLASNTKAFWDNLNTRLADSFRQPSRRVLMESKSHALTLPSAGRFSSQLFVLFNDVFLHYQNNVQAMHPLVTLWVESGMSDGPQQNTLIVTSPEERFEFYCPSTMLKTEWLMNFQSAISRMVKDEKTGNGFSQSSGERFTPPLIRHAMHKFVKAGIYKDASYNGTWLSGKIHGLGQMTWPDESVYVGNFKLGLMHGQGTFSQAKGENKEIQQGTWKDGKLNGLASIIYANGDLYEGHVKDGQRHGHGMLQTGRIKSNCVSIYIGEWLANMRQGYGIEDHILKGEKYMGMWGEDARHGNGVMVTLDGMYFEGSFVHNKLLGFGVMISDDDTLYEGDFVGITYLSGKGILTLPSGDKLEGAFSGSLNEGLKINGTFLKAANTKDSEKHQQLFHGSKSKYFSRLSIPADHKWTNVFAHSYSSLCQSTNSQQPLDSEKAWEAVAVMVSDGLKLLKKEQGTNSTKYKKMQQSILQGLEQIPSRDQEMLDSAKVETISVYLTKAFESSHHPLGQLMNTLVDVFRASYVGVGAHPILLHHAIQEVKSYVRRIYRVVRILFPILPNTNGPVSIQAACGSRDPDGSQEVTGLVDNDSDLTIFTAAGLLYPVLLPKIYPSLFDLYALYNERSDDRYWERVTKLNRQGDVGLMAYLGIEQQFWLMQNILEEGTTQTLSTIKDVCYAEAVDQLQQLSTAFSPVEKLKVIEQTFNQITQTVIASLGDEIVWCMDDLFPIFQFVVVRAKLHHLGAEIHLVEDLMESHLEHGEFGLMFTTLKACYFQIQNEKMPHH